MKNSWHSVLKIFLLLIFVGRLQAQNDHLVLSKLTSNEWGPEHGREGTYLYFYDNYKFKMEGKYLQGATSIVMGDFMVSGQEVVLYPEKSVPDPVGVNYSDTEWVLRYITNNSRPYYSEKLVRKYNDGDIGEYWNYGAPVEVGSILEIDGEKTLIKSSNGFVNEDNVYIRQIPEVGQNRLKFNFFDPSNIQQNNEFIFFLPKGYHVKIVGESINWYTIGTSRSKWFLIEATVGEYNSYKSEIDLREKTGTFTAWVFGKFISENEVR